jgi:hypothetical protein
MISSSIRIRDTLTPAMVAAGAQVQPGRLAKMACRYAEAVFKSHFEKLSRVRHRAGMAHNFYDTASRSTYSQASGDTAFVIVRAPTGLRQRYKGGTLKPTKVYKLRNGRTYSALWIPVGAAVGRTGGDFRGQLAVIWNAGTQKGVAIDRKTKAVLFALVGSVRQEPDPSVVPDMNDLRREVITNVAKNLGLAWQRKQTQEQ